MAVELFFSSIAILASLACLYAARSYSVFDVRIGRQGQDQEASAPAEIAQLATWKTNAKGECTQVNAAWQALAGLKDGQWLGHGWIEALHPADRERVLSIWLRALHEKAPFRCEMRWRRADESALWVLCLGGPAYGPGGELQGFAGVIIDMEDIKDREEALQSAHEQLQDAAATSSALLADMRRDLREPVHGMIGYTQSLLHDHLDDDWRARMQPITDAGLAMMQLLDGDMSDHPGIHSEASIAGTRSTDLRELLDQCVKLVGPAARSKKLPISLWVDEAVPQKVTLDRAGMRQILLNLMSNALKFTQSGGIDIEARLENSTEGQSLLFSVIDTGIGIEDSRLENIFAPLPHQPGICSLQSGEKGLGLSISSKLVSTMGGQISVHSKRGVGTQFTVRLPLKAAECGARGYLKGNFLPDPAALSSLEGAHVLIAGDSGINRELILTIADTLKLDAHLVDDAADAISAVIESEEAGIPFAAVLIDVQMPGLDGLETTRRLRALGYDSQRLPIIALTANCDPLEISKYAAAGMQSHLGKPVTTMALARELARWLVPETQGEADAALLSAIAPDEDGLELRYRARKGRIVADLRRFIEEAPTDTDWDALASQLHNLAEVAAAFGEPELGKASRRLERKLVKTHEPLERLRALKRAWPIFARAA